MRESLKKPLEELKGNPPAKLPRVVVTVTAEMFEALNQKAVEMCNTQLGVTQYAIKEHLRNNPIPAGAVHAPIQQSGPLLEEKPTRFEIQITPELREAWNHYCWVKGMTMTYGVRMALGDILGMPVPPPPKIQRGGRGRQWAGREARVTPPLPDAPASKRGARRGSKQALHPVERPGED